MPSVSRGIGSTSTVSVLKDSGIGPDTINICINAESHDLPGCPLDCELACVFPHARKYNGHGSCCWLLSCKRTPNPKSEVVLG